MKIYPLALVLIAGIFISAHLANAERVVNLHTDESVEKIALSSKVTGAFYHRKRMIPFLPFSKCMREDLGEYKHHENMLKIGDQITFKGNRFEVKDLKVKRFNQYAGTDQQGKIDVCQASSLDGGYRSAEQVCAQSWINFDSCEVAE